ncbi:MAG: glycosyltransferase family 2 protein [Alphaproteobacteria bacterium]|nr:glycosyltransferase family 2 protein [Alphaproteobacteria bacterium]
MKAEPQEPLFDDPTKGLVIGVVIPAFGHPQFLAEAVISACTQDCDARVSVVVVDDGCKFTETGQTVANLMQRFPGMLHYVRQKNTRLPGARNAGVRFLLGLEPEIDSIFFLDADNRIEPYSLRQYRRTLGDEQTVGWAYPDIAFFGLSWGDEGFDVRETAREYSRLKHLCGNISEAGSLVRADMFRAGVFYDETMIHGFEDWDFWLSALEAGFVGKRVEQAGFLYRRRPESMLADSRRQEDELISRMRRKHLALFAPRNLMALGQEEAPSFAIVLHDADQVVLTSDPLVAGKTLAMQGFEAAIAKWYAGRREYFFPENLIVMSEKQWLQLKAQPLFLRWFFWAMKEAEAPYQRWLLEARSYPYHEGISNETPIVGNAVLKIKTEGLVSLLLQEGDIVVPEFSPFVFQTPDALLHGHAKAAFDEALSALCSLVEACKARLSDGLKVRHAGRRYAGPDASSCHSGLIDEICAEENRQAFPATRPCRRLLVAVEQNTLRHSAKRAPFTSFLKRLSQSVDEILLVVERGRKRDLAALGFAEWAHLVTDLVMLDRIESSQEYRMYLSRRIYSLFTLKAKEDGAILARSVDKIVTYGATAFLEVLGSARQHGVKGYVYLDQSLIGRQAGLGEDGAKLLAFEHAEEKIVCDNTATRTAFSAQGFPPGKFMESEIFFDLIGAN